jgi:transposase
LSNKKKAEEALGKSRGGTSTKIHVITEGLGRCVDFVITEGQVHESTQLERLLDGKSVENVIADKGYDADRIREFINGIGGKAVIPCNRARKEIFDYDAHVYKERHLVEVFFQFIKRFRRIGTRYEKKGSNFAGMVMIACVLQWLIF